MVNNRTAVLWIEYMMMVDIRRRFMKAEFSGNWMLHLKAIQEMLPYFAASGHNLYTKSAYIYCQKTHPEISMLLARVIGSGVTCPLI